MTGTQDADRRKKHQTGDIVWDFDGFAAVYGHVDAEAYVAALRSRENFDDWEPDMERITKHLRHSWVRFTPAPPGDDVKMWAWPAKQGTPGAFPVTEGGSW